MPELSEEEAAAIAAQVPEIVFDRSAPAERALVLRDHWGGEVRMSILAFCVLAREGVSDRFMMMAHAMDDQEGAGSGG
jgi:hypothetical protein